MLNGSLRQLEGAGKTLDTLLNDLEAHKIIGAAISSPDAMAYGSFLHSRLSHPKLPISLNLLHNNVNNGARTDGKCS